MKNNNLSQSSNPSFNTITGLSNTTFSPINLVENRMATEAQIQELYQDIVAAEQRRDYCCRDIIVWEAHVQVVRMNTLNIKSPTNLLQGGGAVISDFDENVNIGTMRRGLDYTVTFPLKWNSTLYVARNVAAIDVTNCEGYGINTIIDDINRKIINYRLVEDNTLAVGNCQATNNNYARFWYSKGETISTSVNNNQQGHLINSQNNWGSFVHDIKDDGTVTITDHRRNINYNIIRYYTQWILRRTVDNQTIPDPTF